MKARFLILILVSVINAGIVLASEDVTIVASGTCGESLTWALTSDSVLTINGSDAMTNYSSFSSVPWYNYRQKIKEVKLPQGITTIGNYSFYGCSKLTSVAIPNSVTNIRGYAFEGCTGLTAVHISDMALWCDITFGDPRANPLFYAHNLYLNGELVTDLVIPDGVTRIKSEVFYNCKCITSLTLPNSLSLIYTCAFYNCSEITSVTIPNSITIIDTNAFGDCYNIQTVNISDLTSWCAITFGGGVSNPLYYARNLYVNGELITDLVIPENIETIGARAFGSFQGIKSVTIPNSVTTVGESAFYNCGGLTAVYISDLASWCSISFANYTANPLYIAHNLYLNGELISDLVIPDNIATIGANTFIYSTCLASVTVPNSITKIEMDAFRECSNLKAVHISDLASWCNILHSSIYSNPLSNESSLYLNGELVTDLVIPDTVPIIRSAAFYNCISLKSVVIPEGITYINSYVFSQCKELTSVTIPNSVTKIQSLAFYRCTNLTSITIPDSVTSLGSYAFEECSNLTNVIIGSGVTTIGSDVFYKCTALNTIFNYAPTPQTIVSNVFYGVNKNSCTLYVPKESLGLYQSASVWKDFLVEPIESTTTSIGENSIIDNKNASKILRDGQVFILRGEKVYTVTGQEVR